jgi:hypothetical protein
MRRKISRKLAVLFAALTVAGAFAAPGTAWAHPDGDGGDGNGKCNAGRGNGSEGCDPGNSSTASDGSAGQNQGGDEGGPFQGGEGVD